MYNKFIIINIIFEHKPNLVNIFLNLKKKKKKIVYITK